MKTIRCDRCQAVITEPAPTMNAMDLFPIIKIEVTEKPVSFIPYQNPKQIDLCKRCKQDFMDFLNVFGGLEGEQT